MGEPMGPVQEVFAALFKQAIYVLAAIEPSQTVWAMASAGSFAAVFAFEKTHTRYIAIQWACGVLFAISFVKGIDHFDPDAEAFFAGVLSLGALKYMLQNGGQALGKFFMSYLGNRS